MKKENILGDDIGFIELVDSLGNDLTIVNSARVSFGTRSDWKYEEVTDWQDGGKTAITYKRPSGLKKKDKELVKYLGEHKHFSPYRHVYLQFHVKMPETIAREFYKHCIGADYTFKDHAWNEVSSRYRPMNEFHTPQSLRKQHEDNKQASMDECVENYDELMKMHADLLEHSNKVYQAWLDAGVCKEQARYNLLFSFYTEFFWSASLQAVANFIVLRDHPSAAKEIQLYARAMKELAMSVSPEGLTALLENMK
jgi:thymidylate synthase (FAD)